MRTETFDETTQLYCIKDVFFTKPNQTASICYSRTSCWPFVYHNDDNNPAATYYYRNGQISELYWHIEGKRHREDGPAHIRYRSDGSIMYEHWLINGRAHRIDGPADISYNKEGKIYIRRYYLNGEMVSAKFHKKQKEEYMLNKLINEELL
jgi:hypothetical protein